MANFRTGPNGFNMATGFSQVGPSSYANSGSQAKAVFANGDSEIFTGNIVIQGGIYVAGAATTFQHMSGATLDYQVDGINIPYSVLYAYLPYSVGGGGGPYGYGMVGMTTAAAAVTQPVNPLQMIQYTLKGHDSFFGSSGTDLLIGQGGNDSFFGGSGTEFFQPAGGINGIQGGSGADTVLFSGVRADYSVVDNHDGTITVTDSNAARNGTTNIVNVDALQFADKAEIVTTGDQANIARLYSAALGRPADAPGLNSWESLYTSGVSADIKGQGPFVALAETVPTGFDKTIAGGFTASAEFQQKYGPLDDTGFVTQLYENVLGRAPDAAGLNSWLNVMHNGDSHGMHYTRDMVLVGIAESQENVQKTQADWLFVY